MLKTWRALTGNKTRSAASGQKKACELAAHGFSLRMGLLEPASGIALGMGTLEPASGMCTSALGLPSACGPPGGLHSPEDQEPLEFA